MLNMLKTSQQLPRNTNTEQSPLENTNAKQPPENTKAEEPPIESIEDQEPLNEANVLGPSDPRVKKTTRTQFYKIVLIGESDQSDNDINTAAYTFLEKVAPKLTTPDGRRIPDISLESTRMILNNTPFSIQSSTLIDRKNGARLDSEKSLREAEFVFLFASSSESLMKCYQTTRSVIPDDHDKKFYFINSEKVEGTESLLSYCEQNQICILKFTPTDQNAVENARDILKEVYYDKVKNGLLKHFSGEPNMHNLYASFLGSKRTVTRPSSTNSQPDPTDNEIKPSFSPTLNHS